MGSLRIQIHQVEGKRIPNQIYLWYNDNSHRPCFSGYAGPDDNGAWAAWIFTHRNGPLDPFYRKLLGIYPDHQSVALAWMCISDLIENYYSKNNVEIDLLDKIDEAVLVHMNNYLSKYPR